MSQQRLDCGRSPTLRVEHVQGDLEIRGTEQTQIEASVEGNGQVSLRQDGQVVVLTADRDARLKLPRAATVHVVEIIGDLQVRDLDGPLEADRVEGDALLVHLAAVRISKVGGSLRASEVRGDLGLQGVGGDVRLTDVSGGVRVALGGNLTVKNTNSPLDATAGGDAVLQIEIAQSEPVAVVAGGDIVCRLNGSPSAEVTLSSGGSQTIDLPNVQPDSSTGRFTLGGGEAAVSMSAGGDIWLGGEEPFSGADDVDAIGSRVAASVGKTLAEVEVGLGAMGAVMESVSEAEISTKVQRIVERAIRRQRGRPGSGMPLPVAKGSPETSSATSDEERLKILKMVEDGKLSVEDAEKLFEALEA